MEDFLKQKHDDFKAPDFALDSPFVKWVTDDDPEAGKFWKERLEKNPGRKKEIDAARSLVLALQFHNEEVTIQFTGDTREVTLEGEVAHDSQRPFKVHTGSVVTNVSGTSFNIDAYSGDSDVKIALVEGKVWMNTQKRSGSVGEHLLNPMEMINSDKKLETSEVSKFSQEEITWNGAVSSIGHYGLILR